MGHASQRVPRSGDDAPGSSVRIRRDKKEGGLNDQRNGCSAGDARELDRAREDQARLCVHDAERYEAGSDTGDLRGSEIAALSQRRGRHAWPLGAEGPLASMNARVRARTLRVS